METVSCLWPPRGLVLQPSTVEMANVDAGEHALCSNLVRFWAHISRRSGVHAHRSNNTNEYARTR